VDYEKLSSDRLGESSAAIRERVQAARERQRARFEGSTGALFLRDEIVQSPIDIPVAGRCSIGIVRSS
jgi:predicted ATPase with chaperone activity